MARLKAAKTTIAPFSGRRRIADEIAEDLRGQIASGEIPHGARLPAERDLAERYRVSGPTVREALQGLNAMGLLDVRHGSGTYVSALADTLVARALGTVIQLQRVGVQDLFGLLGALHNYAARLAVTQSTADDIAALEEAIDEIGAAPDVEGLQSAVKDFIIGLAAAAHDPLLFALVSFLVDIQLELAMKTTGSTFEEWQHLVGLLQPDRIAIVEALKRRDADEYAARINAFNARAVKLVDAEVRLHGNGTAQLADIIAQLAVRGIASRRPETPSE
jgi:GntR family transcriptional regulator, transcriptional repressor for pyruvate dehydrogenase complex